MRLTRGTTISLIFVALVVILQIWYATTSACPADTVSKFQCWGPRGINFWGLNINIGYVKTQLFTTLFVLAIALVIPIVVSKIKVDKPKEKLVNLGLFLFSIFYIVTSLFILFSQMGIKY
ncbi:MAG TPA: hypothetical protein VJI15_02755 [Candidatus Nanoarchaeia archaeon]|nr:hypothetical protein [Candidatus Nanoarchaeia archaeon]